MPGMGYRPARKREEEMQMKKVCVLRVGTGICVALCAFMAFLLFVSSAAAAHDPLIEVLIRKGVLTEDEAREIEKEAAEIEREREAEKARAEAMQHREEIREVRHDSIPKPLQGLKFRMLSYLDYSAGEENDSSGNSDSYNTFSIKRGYFRVDKKITPWLGAHLTYDVHQESGGDWKARLKYLYAEFRPGDLGFFTDNRAELGMGHIPWLDFEEHINPYRCQGTMAIERAGTFNSADLGISIRGNLGGRLDDAGSTVGNHHYDGRWGSWHVGVYNGSGYHSTEKNGNKVFEGRLSLRPFPDILPGLQFSGFMLNGEANNRNANNDFPDYQAYVGMMSFQHPRLILTTQYITTHGNKDGSWTDARGHALWTQGASVFLNVKPPIYGLVPSLDRKLNFFFRYDWMDRDKKDRVAKETSYNMYIIGSAWEVFRGNFLLMDYEWTTFGDDFGYKKSAAPSPGLNPDNEHKFQMVYQLKF